MQGTAYSVWRDAPQGNSRALAREYLPAVDVLLRLT